MMLLQTYHQLYVDVLTLLYYNTCTYLCKLSLLQGCTSTKTLSSTAAGNAISFTAVVYMTSSEQYTPTKAPKPYGACFPGNITVSHWIYGPHLNYCLVGGNVVL
jgi:hypothetical protein